MLDEVDAGQSRSVSELVVVVLDCGNWVILNGSGASTLVRWAGHSDGEKLKSRALWKSWASRHPASFLEARLFHTALLHVLVDTAIGISLVADSCDDHVVD